MTCKMCGDGMRGWDLRNSSNPLVLLGLLEASGDHGEVSTTDKKSSEVKILLIRLILAIYGMVM